MKTPAFAFRAVGLLLIILIAGCSQLNQVAEDREDRTDERLVEREDTVERDVPLEEESVKNDESGYVEYEKEELLLVNLMQLHDEAIIAYNEGEFGIAETKIDSAAVMATSMDLPSIGNAELKGQVRTVLSSIYQLYGQMLARASELSQEDPTAWLDELTGTNPEEFKNGKWTDTELRTIVNRIALRSDVPLDYNDKVKNAISFFQMERRAEMTKWLQRSGKYLPLIQSILEEEELPLDLAYLSMIESGFSPTAYSRARAVGLWQFIYSTGRLYGLTRDEWMDERRDPVKATRAAAQHMKDLYKMYGDWKLVMAAYNCGPTRVTRQFQNNPEIEFWDLQLPRETQNYVPSFVAAVVIAKAPELFGFENIEYEEPFEFETVEVHPYTSLETAAECAGVDESVIKEYNIELRRDRTPIGDEKYALKIPVGTREQFEIAYADVPVEEYTPPRMTSYVVRRNDTLSAISLRTGVSVSRLMQANNISNPRRLRIGQRLSIPGTGSAQPRIVNVNRDDAQVYVVRRNDTLWDIAQKYNTTVGTLQVLNNMGRSSRIMPNQRLLVPGSGENVENTRVATAEEIENAGEQVYIIRKNDTLYEIAQKYGVSYRDIMRWNEIRNHRTIRPGQRIVIRTGE